MLTRIRGNTLPVEVGVAFISRRMTVEDHQGEEQWTGRLSLGKYNGKPNACRGYGPSGLENMAKRSISREESSLNPIWLRFCGSIGKSGVSMSLDCALTRSESAFEEAMRPNPGVAHPLGRLSSSSRDAFSIELPVMNAAVRARFLRAIRPGPDLPP
jgi:hypothetical protein